MLCVCVLLAVGAQGREAPRAAELCIRASTTSLILHETLVCLVQVRIIQVRCLGEKVFLTNITVGRAGTRLLLSSIVRFSLGAVWGGRVHSCPNERDTLLYWTSALGLLRQETDRKVWP